MRYIGALDQGTTSTRFIIFNEKARIVSVEQIEHKQIYPRPGWVEHNGEEIRKNTDYVIRSALDKAGLSGRDINAVGITNQRETVIPFLRSSGKILHNAIVWQDLRGEEIIKEARSRMSEEELKERTGLLYSPYFAASKIRWLLDNVDSVKEAAKDDDLCFATMDAYIMYCLSGVCVTDVTNASRYMLMNINTLSWDDDMLALFSIRKENLPEIVPSSGRVYAFTREDGPFAASVPLAAILGDQQAALFGQACFDKGQSKCTYGTGCFLLLNTGTERYLSSLGLLTTVAYQIDGMKPYYALEGSIAVAGSLVQWARDNLKLVKDAKELDMLAEQVADTGGVYIVPAFAGLFAPYWRSDARGVIAGLTGYTRREHICRAVLEATAFQVYDIFSSMEEDTKIKLESLKVDGGMTNSAPLMRFQSDILNLRVDKPEITETTALGAAFAAGLTAGVWKSTAELEKYWRVKESFSPLMDDKERENRVGFWKKAVSRTLGWL